MAGRRAATSSPTSRRNIVSPGGGGGTGGDALGALAHSPGANATSTFSVINVTLSDNTSTPGAGGAAAHGGNAASGGAGGIGGQGGARVLQTGPPAPRARRRSAAPVDAAERRNRTGGATMPGSSSSQNLIAFLQSTVAFNSAAAGSTGAVGAGGTGSATGTAGAAGTGGSVLGSGLGGSATLSGTMITNNAGGTQCQFAPATPIVSSGHNLASDASCNLTQASDLASNTLAGLGLLADNGGVALPRRKRALHPLDRHDEQRVHEWRVRGSGGRRARHPAQSAVRHRCVRAQHAAAREAVPIRRPSSSAAPRH